MNQNIKNILFSYLRSAICGNKKLETNMDYNDPELISNLFAVSNKHDIAHLVSRGLDMDQSVFDTNNTQVCDCMELFRKAQMMSIYRSERMTYEFNKICEILEREKFKYIPLKGAVLRNYYPEIDMRTSSDIDILVQEDSMENVINLLTEKYGFAKSKVGSHDISLYSPSKVHFELHYKLVEDGRAMDSSKILSTVWSNVSVKKGYQFFYKMTDEMFYFYHIAHMAKHFEYGGCGIKYFIDLWILDNMEEADHKKRNELLEQGNLLKFAEAARKLSRIWFDNEEHTEITRQMEEYILNSGAYGNIEQFITIQQQKKGGRLKYALSKIFLSYDNIKYHYPILQKHRWLTPFMEVRRWCKLIFCGHAKRSLKELKYSQSISTQKADEVGEFLKNIGL